MIDGLNILDFSADQWLVRLFHASWQGALFLGLAWMIVRSLKTLDASIRCWIWRIAFLKFLLVLFFYGAVQLPWLTPTHSNSQVRPRVEPANQISNYQLGSDIGDAESHFELASVVHPSESRFFKDDFVPGEQKRAGESATAGGKIWVYGVAFVWLLGVSILLLNVIWQYRSAIRLLKNADPVSQPRMQALYRMVSAQLKMSSPPDLMTSVEVESPVLVGAINPVILIPASLLSVATDGDLKMALAHELSHAKRKDLIWNWVFVAVRTLFFFHPLVWIFQKRIALDQEIACDQMALSATKASLEQYGNLLVKFSAATMPGAVNSLATVGAASSFETLKVRILEMKKYRSPGTHLSKWSSVIVVIGACFLAIPFSLVAQEAGTTSNQENKNQSAQQNSTQRASSAKQSSSASASSSSNSETGRASDGTTQKTKRQSANVSVAENGVEESMKVTWHPGGSIAIQYRSNETGTKKTKKYRVDSIDELEAQNKRAFDFYNKHVKKSKDGVSVNASSQAGPGNSVGRTTGSNSTERPYQPERYRSTGERPMSGASASSSASSSSWSRSSSASRNGRAQSDQASGSTSSRSSTSGPNANRLMVEQLKRMMGETSDPKSKELIQEMLNQIQSGK